MTAKNLNAIEKEEVSLSVVKNPVKNNILYFTQKETMKNDLEFSLSDDIQVAQYLHEQYIKSLKTAIYYKKLNGECVYDNNGKLFCIQIKNKRNLIEKAYFISAENKITSVNDYNPETGRHARTILYRENEMTVSSIKDYDFETGEPMSSIFFKKDGKTVSSMFEYSNNGKEIKYTLFCDDGEVFSEYV